MSVRVMVFAHGMMIGVRLFSRVPCVGEKVAIGSELLDVDYVCHDVELTVAEHLATIHLRKS